MKTRREFLQQSGAAAFGYMLLPSLDLSSGKVKNPGIQLYTFRKELLADVTGTLKQIAGLGFKQIESAGSEKGSFYGLKPKEMKQACSDLGMTLRSGHVHVDDKWKQTIDNAVESGQEYMICSSMPEKGQTVDNYKKAAESFNKCGEDCKKVNIRFGYHNHDAEFEQSTGPGGENGKVLYDVLLENTDPSLVHMEMDLGWAVFAGKDPIAYFDKYPGRFPLWHLKDMDMVKRHSTEFGKGILDIKKMLDNEKKAGMKYIFVEQEEFTNNAYESMKEDMAYLENMK
jgi:sugar phosphate isomerase/epimerase